MSCFFFSSRRRHTRCSRDWSSDVCSSDLIPDVPTIEATDREIAARRTRLIQRQRLLGRFVIGPAAASAFILGVSGMMLPGADGFAQSQFILNDALSLGISYSLI